MKKAIFVLVAALALSSFAACGSSSSGNGAAGPAGNPASAAQETSPDTQAGAQSGDQTINFYAHSDNTVYINAQVEGFNALDNGIQVLSHIIANDAYDDKVKVLAAGGGESMDVFWIRSPSQVQQYVGNKALADLSGFASESGVDLSPVQNYLTSVSDDSGKFYGMPTVGSAWMLFYNKDLFDAKGLPYPENLTWDQYCDLAAQLVGTEDGKKYWGGLLPPWTMNLGASSAGEYLTAAEPMPFTHKYVEVLNRMYVADKSHPGIAEMSAGTFDVNSVFTSGTVYMMINGDWCLQLLDTEFEYGVAPLPAFEGVEAESTVGQASYYCVSAKSSLQKEAYQFIEYCTASVEGSCIYASEQAVPCYATDEALAIFKEKVKTKGIEYRFSAKTKSEQGTEAYYNDVNTAYKQELELYLLGEQSIEAMFDNFYSLRDEAIAG